MATDPQRRRGDARRPQARPFGPTPGALGPPDAAAMMRSLEHALASARRMRRPITLVVLELAHPADGDALARVADLVRRTVRDTDGIWRDGRCGLALVLMDADGPTGEPALARLRMRLRSEGLRGVLMGRAAAAPGIGAADLLDLAREDRQRDLHRRRVSGLR